MLPFNKIFIIAPISIIGLPQILSISSVSEDALTVHTGFTLKVSYFLSSPGKTKYIRWTAQSFLPATHSADHGQTLPLSSNHLYPQVLESSLLKCRKALPVFWTLVFLSVYWEYKFRWDRLFQIYHSPTPWVMSDSTPIPWNFLLLPFPLDTDVIQLRHFPWCIVERFSNTICREYTRHYSPMSTVWWANFTLSHWYFLNTAELKIILWTSDVSRNNQNILLSKKRIILSLCFDSLSLIFFRKASPTSKS